MTARKKWFQAIVLALIALGVVWSLISPSESFHDCIRDRKNNQPYQSLHKDRSIFVQVIPRLQLNAACAFVSANDNTGAITGIAGVVVAIFTGTLWWVTYGMIGIAKDQRADTLRAVKASEQAAEATELIAKATIALEGPSLFIAKISVTTWEGGSFLDWLRRADFNVLFENYGRSPAFVYDVDVRIYVGDLPPEKHTASRRYWGLERNFVAMPGKTHEFFVGMPFREIESNIPSSKILDWMEIDCNSAGRASLDAEFPDTPLVYIYGTFRYSDVATDHHEVGFVYLCVELMGGCVPLRHRSTYSYRRRLPPNEQP